jgi:5-methylcytosine-specific restriction protein A
MRKEFSRSTKAAAFLRSAGFCEQEHDGKRCGAKLTVGKFHYDHVNPDGLTGEPTLENCAVICVGCHLAKTKKDVADIARAKRREANHIGAKPRSRNPLPGSKGADGSEKWTVRSSVGVDNESI